jgi:hypothetical protein
MFRVMIASYSHNLLNDSLEIANKNSGPAFMLYSVNYSSTPLYKYDKVSDILHQTEDEIHMFSAKAANFWLLEKRGDRS